MKTVCHESVFFSNSGKKDFVFNFDGGNIGTDGGALLISKALGKTGISGRIADCLSDSRQMGKVKHSVTELLHQRLTLLALGYKDCNDSNTLRKDPIIKSALGILPEKGRNLASQSTLSRLENCVTARDIIKLQAFKLDLFVENLVKSGKKQVILDIDTTDDETYGHQEGSLFNGYYKETMYTELLIFDAETGDLAAAKLETGTRHTSFNSVVLLHRVISGIRKKLPDIKIIVRGDSGYGIPALMNYCERIGVFYILGIKSNGILQKKSQKLLKRAITRYIMTDKPQSYYGSIQGYRASSWSRERKVFFRTAYDGKTRLLRFIVTNMDFTSPKEAYKFYGKRGQMENYIKELKNGLHSDRLSCHAWYANYFRLMLSAFAYTVMQKIRECLKGTSLENAVTDSIRLHLLKIGTHVRETVRKVWISFSSTFTGRDMFLKVYHMLV